MNRPWVSEIAKGFGRFDESKHPRRGGRFAPKGGGGSSPTPATPKAPKNPRKIKIAHAAAHLAEHHGIQLGQGTHDHESGKTLYAVTHRDGKSGYLSADQIKQMMAQRGPAKPAAPVSAPASAPVSRHNPDLDAAFGEAPAKPAVRTFGPPRQNDLLDEAMGASKPAAPTKPAARGPDIFAEHQAGTQNVRQHPSQDVLPHHKTQAAALDAARGVKAGDHASHQRAVAALDAHYKEGLAALKRMAGSRVGGKAHRAAAEAFRAKIGAARGKIDQIAGRGPPPVPRQAGAKGPPPLADRGKVRPWVSMKAFDLDLSLPMVTKSSRPWLTKSRDASGHEHAADGRFGNTAGSHKPATRKPGAQYDRKPGKDASHGKAESKARTLAKRISEVPAQLKHQVTSFVRGRYRRLSKRYGPKGAYAIIGAAILLLPVPVPGSSLIPIAVAETILALKRAVTKGHEADLSPEQIKTEAKRLVRELYAACGEEMPK